MAIILKLLLVMMIATISWVYSTFPSLFYKMYINLFKLNKLDVVPGLKLRFLTTTLNK